MSTTCFVPLPNKIVQTSATTASEPTGSTISIRGFRFSVRIAGFNVGSATIVQPRRLNFLDRPAELFLLDVGRRASAPSIAVCRLVWFVDKLSTLIRVFIEQQPVCWPTICAPVIVQRSLRGSQRRTLNRLEQLRWAPIVGFVATSSLVADAAIDQLALEPLLANCKLFWASRIGIGVGTTQPACSTSTTAPDKPAIKLGFSPSAIVRQPAVKPILSSALSTRHDVTSKLIL